MATFNMKKFWSWYEKHETFALTATTGLFVLQLIHLFWLFAHVIMMRLTGVSYFDTGGIWKFFILIVDYTEIPALIATSILYLNEYRKTKSTKSLLFLFFLNTQWIHLFWITDEFVVTAFTGNMPLAIPAWLAWVAILIDYLELPVIYDTLRKFTIEIKNGNLKKALYAIREAE